MSSYTLGLTALQHASAAIDTVSNNIANANTVGYKAGEYAFADQFIRSVSPSDRARTGMGVQRISVRRPMTQGTIVNSANPLDMAISGNGMFRLLQSSGMASSVDPTAVYYTRNGQFGVDKQGYIVNENGMYLTGFQAMPDGTMGDDLDLKKNNGLLKIPAANLEGRETTTASIAALLDSRTEAFTTNAGLAFDPTQATYNAKTTQTVFDYDGNQHTLEVYFRRIGDSKLTITSQSDGSGFTYSPGPTSVPNTLGDTLVTINANSVLRVDTAAGAYAAASADTANGTTINLSDEAAISGTNPNVTGYRVFVNGVDTGAVVKSGGATTTLTTNVNVTVPKGAEVSFYPPLNGASGSALSGAVSNSTAIALSAAPSTDLADKIDGARIFKLDTAGNYTDTGATVSSLSGANITASKAVTLASTDKVVFYRSDLDMTLLAPDGTRVTVQGFTNKKNSGEELTSSIARVEVFASLDGRFYDRDADVVSDKSLTPVTDGVLEYRKQAELNFVGGRNIDSLFKDAASGNPEFRTVTNLSAIVTNAAGGQSDLNFSLDLSDVTLGPGAFQVTRSVQDGEPMTRLTSISVDNQGRIAGVYGGGKQVYVGQVALVHFDQEQGLVPVGKNVFAPSIYSGTEDSAEGVIVGRAGTGKFGDIKAQALESSNVDLADELVRLMVLQRSYTASSQALKAADSVMQDSLRLNT